MRSDDGPGLPLPVPSPHLLLLLLLLLGPSGGLGMEIMAPPTILALNGSSVRLTCTFNSCYQVEKKQFSLNWTYQGCENCTEDAFLQFKLKALPIEPNRFGGRVEFTGNPSKNDVSFTLHNVQLDDEGLYRCYVMNPPDRHKGIAKIDLKVITEGLHLCCMTQALEVSVGKAAVIYAQNGTDVLLPCTFTTCIGFDNAKFSWTRNGTEIYGGTIKNKDSKPIPNSNSEAQEVDKYMLPEVNLLKDNKEYNISILVLDVDFSDSGKYNCKVENPREKNAKHNATITLQVVVQLEKVDNTLTLIILSVVGGVIGLIVLIMVVKKLVLFILKKTQEKNRECLVSSSANDNTENGLAGSKAEQKPSSKA